MFSLALLTFVIAPATVAPATMMPIPMAQDLAELEKTLVRAVDKSTYDAGAYQAAKELADMRSVEAMELRLELFDEKLTSYRGVFLRDWFFSGMLKAKTAEEFALIAQAAADKKNSDLLRWVCLRALAESKVPISAKELMSKNLRSAKNPLVFLQWQRTLGRLYANDLLDLQKVKADKVLAVLNTEPGLGLAQLYGSDNNFSATVIELIGRQKHAANQAELLRSLARDRNVKDEAWKQLLRPFLSQGKSKDWNCALRSAAIDIIRERKLAILVPDIIKGLRAEVGNGGGRFAVDYGDLLMDLTGMKIGRNPEVWERWWSRAGEQWLADGAPVQGGGEQRPEQETVTSLFGVPVNSHRLVLAIDGSGSMNDQLGETTCLEAARREISNLLERISEDTLFDLVIIEKTHISAFGKLAKNTAKNRKKALALLDKREFRSTSALYDALLDIQDNWEADTILLIGDGGSSAGTHQYPGHMLSGIEVEYARSGVRIHTICTTSQKSKLSFMRKLAAVSGGTMVQPPG